MIQLPKLKIDPMWVEAGPVDEELYFTDYWLAKRLPQMHKEIAEQTAAIEASLALCRTKMDNTSAPRTEWLASMDSGVKLMRRYVGLQKVPAIVDIVTRELESGAYGKLLIFAIHQNVIEELRSQLRKFNAITLYGKTPAFKRQKVLDKFIKRSDHKIVIGNVNAIGTGVDGLQSVCSEALFAEQSYVPGDNVQAIMRLHRIGQEYPVRVRIAMLADTVDERVEQILKRKTRDLLEMFD